MNAALTKGTKNVTFISLHNIQSTNSHPHTTDNEKYNPPAAPSTGAASVNSTNYRAKRFLEIMTSTLNACRLFCCCRSLNSMVRSICLYSIFTALGTRCHLEIIGSLWELCPGHIQMLNHFKQGG